MARRHIHHLAALFHALKVLFKGQHRLLGTFSVSDIGSGDFDLQQQAIGVNEDVTFAAFDLFTTIEATCAPFFVVLTD